MLHNKRHLSTWIVPVLFIFYSDKYLRLEIQSGDSHPHQYKIYFNKFPQLWKSFRIRFQKELANTRNGCCREMLRERDHTRALLEAIHYFGSQTALSHALKISSKRINNWLNRNDMIPFHFAAAIEKLTGGEINRYELAPYASFLLELKPIPPHKKTWRKKHPIGCLE